MRFVLAFLFLAGASCASAQSVDLHPGPRRTAVWREPRGLAQAVPPGKQVVLPHPASTHALVGVGLLAGTAAFFGGGILGATLENHFAPCSCDDSGLVGLLYGVLAGPALVIPPSIHLTNHGMGSLGLTFGAALLAGGAALALGAVTGNAPIAFIGAPVAELAASVLAQRATEKR